ncbi:MULTISPECIES: BrxA/BrxB family bacilliredoxin [Epilithonimonas]|jgi:putative YphP/YqiW family bacilliredoxin|uniref:BrxA/BrxB family bacilliredoxin n=2 Tax=Epilithonimonas TaxID=2782229 RepID=A0A3G8YC16_9FLAO|nr:MULTISPECIES: BrxA/BrxB family bacilliredoxin [Epilithonimonas]HAP94174.1 BrxA/BrxB family bacilliredoxin [Chryseobacterium sp.]AZI38721.1 BrxA/BrxB family bacilliredoxin [Epilithonimonas vandammei]AZI54024.1 BrxA/BrxB family bacilliredoxin [Epilithonimonas vandammei]ROI11984.1 BrxA/BrxB family bacilliredoxin [Epilithonimonas hominis]SEH41527.1 putative bacilliredoxin, YphP/YqiW family [Epilithonimonas hominis]
MYPADLVLPMKAELTDKGFQDLTTPAQVDEAIKQSGTTLLVINSVCGCAAGAARPGVLYSLTGEKKPDHLVTAFAGFDTEAVAEARRLLAPFPPSSPAVALFKDGELVHMLERHHIEGNPAGAIAANLQAAFDEYC